MSGARGTNPPGHLSAVSTGSGNTGNRRSLPAWYRRRNIILTGEALINQLLCESLPMGQSVPIYSKVY